EDLKQVVTELAIAKKDQDENVRAMAAITLYAVELDEPFRTLNIAFAAKQLKDDPSSFATSFVNNLNQKLKSPIPIEEGSKHADKLSVLLAATKTASSLLLSKDPLIAERIEQSTINGALLQALSSASLDEANRILASISASQFNSVASEQLAGAREHLLEV